MIAAALLLAAAQQAEARADWLLAERPYEAEFRVETRGTQTRFVLDNGLVRRTWLAADNLACIGFDNLMTEASMLRAVRPEARLVVEGQELAVGGLVGQPNHAFLTDAWLQEMNADPQAMRFVGWELGEPAERLEWPRIRHHAPDMKWPPPGVAVRFDFEPGLSVARDLLLHSDYARGLLFSDAFAELKQDWTVHASHGDASSAQNEGKAGEIQTAANHAVYLEMAAPEGLGRIEAEISPGTDASASWGPGVAAVFADGRVIKFNLRPGKNGLGVWDGQTERVADGSWPMDRPTRLRIYLEQDRVVCAAMPSYGPGDRGGMWQEIFELPAAGAAPTHVRVGKMDKAGGASGFSEAGPIGRCKIDALTLRGALDESMLAEVQKNDARNGLRVSVHYELYDGIPLIGKRVVVRNAGEKPIELDHLTTETLAVVESSNYVEKREGAVIPQPEHFHVETDYAFGGMVPENAQSQIVHWRPDPEFHTQVNYRKLTPCLLEVAPLHGPDVILEAGDELASWWTFELVHDSSDRERRSLGQRRMYRTLAPWVTENPLILHVVSTDEAVVKRAIDQAAECGFEMLSLSFGSGLNMEDDSEANHAKFRALADYAMERGIHIGGYSLLASRRIQPDSDNAIHVETGKPGGQTFGYAPALASAWGQEYFRKLYAFFENTGFLQFTHDGSYPGDWDAAARPPLQRGYEDSQWVQWNIITEYYRWLRARGAYLRVPDFYYLQGANECGMGYREVNWSLPRAQQVIHTRQNIFDGTWIKTPSMGWMFVPLTQYHGGGAAATIEPLDEHLDHYERMLASNLGLGVQAVYRGHRLYDTARVRDAVKRWVDWFKHYRDILESDVLHLRRADGRELDWMLHVGPTLDLPGMLVVYNPLEVERTRTIRVPLYLTGLDGQVLIESAVGPQIEAARRELQNVSREYEVEIEVTVPAGGMLWCSFRKP
ncbi:MAG: hypothetical protein CMJ94_03430 [Planctomycetes bacterium]|nr:hypothetical protein [Planctomycetota bacterium]